MCSCFLPAIVVMTVAAEQHSVSLGIRFRTDTGALVETVGTVVCKNQQYL